MGYKKAAAVKAFLKSQCGRAFMFHVNHLEAVQYLWNPQNSSTQSGVKRQRRKQSTDSSLEVKDVESEEPERKRRRLLKKAGFLVPNHTKGPLLPSRTTPKRLVSTATTTTTTTTTTTSQPLVSCLSQPSPTSPSFKIAAVDVGLLLISTHSAISSTSNGSTTINGRVFLRVLFSGFNAFLNSTPHVDHVIFAIDAPRCMRPPPKTLDDENRHRPQPTEALVGQIPSVPFTQACFPSRAYVTSHPETIPYVTEFLTREIIHYMSAYQQTTYVINQGCVLDPESRRLDYCVVQRELRGDPVIYRLTTTAEGQLYNGPGSVVLVGEGENIATGEALATLQRCPIQNRCVVLVGHDTDLITYSTLLWYRMILQGQARGLRLYILAKHYGTNLGSLQIPKSKKLYTINIERMVASLDYYYSSRERTILDSQQFFDDHNGNRRGRKQSSSNVIQNRRPRGLRQMRESQLMIPVSRLIYTREGQCAFAAVLCFVFVMFGCDFIPRLGSYAGLHPEQLMQAKLLYPEFGKLIRERKGRRLPYVVFNLTKVIASLINIMATTHNPVVALSIESPSRNSDNPKQMTIEVDIDAILLAVSNSRTGKIAPYWTSKIRTGLSNALFVMQMCGNPGSNDHVMNCYAPQYGYIRMDGRCFQSLATPIKRKKKLRRAN